MLDPMEVDSPSADDQVPAHQQASKSRELVLQLVARSLADEPAALARMCLVSSAWFKAARHVLWSHPLFILLCRIQNPYRRQLYAEAITWLDLICTNKELWDQNIGLLETTRFPRLTKLTISPRAAESASLKFIEKFFCPTLQQVELLAVPANKHFLQLIERCSSLRHLRLNRFGKDITDSRCFQFLQSFPRLQAFQLGAESEFWKHRNKASSRGDIAGREILSKRVTMVVANLTRTVALRSLSIGCELSPGVVRSFNWNTAQVGSIKHLRISIDTSAVQDLVSNMASIRDLRITLHTARSSDYPLYATFEALSNLRTLRSLNIFLDEDATDEFEQKTMYLLQPLKQLESLTLRNSTTSTPNMRVEKRWIGPTLANITSNWPLLRSLRVELRAGELTAYQLAKIGKNCPRLDSLAVWGTVNGTQFGDMVNFDEVAYTQLEEFEIWEAIAPGRTVAAAREGLLWQMPKLKIFRRPFQFPGARETSLWHDVQACLVARWNMT